MSSLKDLIGFCTLKYPWWLDGYVFRVQLCCPYTYHTHLCDPAFKKDFSYKSWPVDCMNENNRLDECMAQELSIREQPFHLLLEDVSWTLPTINPVNDLCYVVVAMIYCNTTTTVTRFQCHDPDLQSAHVSVRWSVTSRINPSTSLLHFPMTNGCQVLFAPHFYSLLGISEWRSLGNYDFSVFKGQSPIVKFLSVLC